MLAETFSGKKALVVGGSGGIGAAISRLLAEAGTELVVHGGSESRRFDLLMEELTALHEEAAARLSLASAEVKKPEALVQKLTPENFNDLADSALAGKAASCDILCVCYGPFVQKPLDAMTAGDWQTVALLDYALPGLLVSLALPGMQERCWGRILLFGGTGTESRREFRTNAGYAGAKTAVGTLVQSTAAAYAHCGITCNALLPGFTQTEYTETAGSGGAGTAAALARKMPGGTLLLPESAARTAMFLLENPDINGALLRFDRGWSPVFAV